MRFEDHETKLGVRAWEGAVHHQEIEIWQDRREVAREARGPGAIGTRFATALAARLLPVREEAQAPHAGNPRLTLRAGRLRAAEDEGDERAIRVFDRGRERGAQPCVASAPAQRPGEARFGIVDSERPVDTRGELAVDWPPDCVRAGERRVKGSGQLRWRGRSRECGEQHRSRVPHRDGKHRTLVSVFASLITLRFRQLPHQFLCVRLLLLLLEVLCEYQCQRTRATHLKLAASKAASCV